jgi:hypothetical protein
VALSVYQSLFTALIQAPNSPVPLISTAAMNSYINDARAQVASEGECIRVPATLALTNGVQKYFFTGISVAPIVTGASQTLSVRLANLGGVPMEIRPWEWFANYYLGSTSTGIPAVMAQQGQGLAGTLFFSPIPNASFTLSLDVVAVAIALVDDTTVEAIPYPWTDAIPFYAAWLGMMNEQRQGDADKMLQRYEELMLRARRMSSPSVLPDNLPGSAGTKMAATKATIAGAGGAQPQAGG